MIAIDLESATPLEEQIRLALRQLIALGKLASGDPLPSVRQLAGDLGVHWNTVARAYRRLQEEGLLMVLRGRGVFVRSGPGSTARRDPATRDRLLAKLREVFADARLVGLSPADLRRLLHQELKRWSAKEVGS